MRLVAAAVALFVIATGNPIRPGSASVSAAGKNFQARPGLTVEPSKNLINTSQRGQSGQNNPLAPGSVPAAARTLPNFPYSSVILYGFAGGMAGFSIGLVTSIFTAASFGLLPNFSTTDALFLFGAASSVLGMVWGGYYALSQKKLEASFVYTMLSAAAGFGVAFGLGLATGSNALFWTLWPVLSLAGAVVGLRLTVERRQYSIHDPAPSSRASAREEGETVVGLRFVYRFGLNE